MDEAHQSSIAIDMKCFSICSWCLRVIPILLAEGYCLYLFSKQLLKTRRYYDSLDKFIFLLSALSIATSILSILFLQLAISSFSYVLKLVWTLGLFLVFMRFIFKDHQCSKIFLLSVLSLVFYYFLMIFFYRVVPIRYPLLALYISIGLCAFHQILNIRDILSNQRAKKKQMKKFLEKKTKQIQMQLLDRRQKREETLYKSLSNPFKYHIKLRKSFCTAIIVCLGVNYFFLWDVEESRNSLGEFFVVFTVELLLPLAYFFYTTGNQWIIEQLRQDRHENNSSRASSRKELSNDEGSQQ